jgi:hypothetical protein
MKCTVTNEPMVSCYHCLNSSYIEAEPTGPEYEKVGMAFRTSFKGTCTVDRRHTIKKNDLVCKVQRADNPGIPITGVACKNCTHMLPRART